MIEFRLVRDPDDRAIALAAFAPVASFSVIVTLLRSEIPPKWRIPPPLLALLPVNVELIIVRSSVV